ncbi:MAG: flagellar biosynthesis anti-sigma factor FlgM [Novosphingobium sp.]
MPIDSTPPVASPIGGLRAVNSSDARLLQKSVAQRPATPAGGSPASVIVTSQGMDAGPVPIDNERVAEVRKAVEAGTYPLVPAKVADAIIAAGLLLRNPK